MSEPSESPHDSLNYAFLVHSQKTLTQNLPPRVDNKLLARQKRRRTSPEDHAVLEAAYQQNPKPDKASRAAIVSRVSLGEKEVQIWFQNRRQNDRRKSKPLQPHELLAPRVAMEPSSEDTPETLDDEISAEVEADHDASSSQIAPDEPLSSSQAPTDEGPSSSQIATDIDETDVQTQQTQQQTQTTTTAQAPTPTTGAAAGTEAARVMTPETSKRKRSSSDLQDAKVKSPPSLRISLSFDGEALVRKEGEITPSPPKSRSALRISMSSDGEAVIRADNEPSPSKNRLRRVTARRSLSGCVGAGLPGSHSSRSLRRSHSAILPVTPRAATAAAVADRERPFGRSRDPRVWQSTFDTDARSALSNSSCKSPAASADGTTPPSLFRSRSQRSSLSSRQNILANHNQNSPIPVPVPGSVHEKRRKLSRTVSSLGRLESNIINGNNTRSPLSKVLTSSSSSNSASNPSKMGKGEDDDENKENWIPGTRISNNHLRRRTTVSHSARPVLADSNQKRSRLSQKDKDASIPGSQDEDLDCIQGLLSLSQGAWR